MSVTYHTRKREAVSPALTNFQSKVSRFFQSQTGGPPPWLGEIPAYQPISGVKVEKLVLSGVPCIRTSAGKDESKAVLFIHGGGFVSGSMEDGLLLLPEITARSGIHGYSLDYSLVPDAVYPTQLHQCRNVYLKLLAMGYQQIAVAGVSAGGNLAMALALYIRERGLQLPASLALMSPQIDMSDAVKPKHPDPLTSNVSRVGNYYAPGHDLKDPILSPFFADWNGMPPSLIQAGTNECLHEWLDVFAERLQQERSDVSMEYSLWTDLGHGFALEGCFYPEGYEGREQVIEFLLSHFK